MREIKEFPVENYDLIVNDFEPITAWAARKKEVPIISLSHQAALLSKNAPRPKFIDPFGEWILRNYAPVKKYVGFHFEEYDKNIFTPVIRAAIRHRIVNFFRRHLAVASNEAASGLSTCPARGCRAD